MKKSLCHSRPAYAALLLALLPFVVAFDYPDTTGIRGKISAGRGTYSISSCSRSFQSEYVEENVALSATFATGSEGTSWRKRLRPGKTTLGAYGNWVQEERLLVREEGSSPASPASPEKSDAVSFGAYSQFDWRLFGLQIGGLNLSRWHAGEDNHGNEFLPSAEIRLGPEYLFAGTSLLSSAPVLSGGGGWTAGVGGRIRGTRIWGGYSVFPIRNNGLGLKLSQTLGSANLSFAGQWALESSRYSATREHGLSLGLDIPLSKAW